MWEMHSNVEERTSWDARDWDSCPSVPPGSQLCGVGQISFLLAPQFPHPDRIWGFVSARFLIHAPGPLWVLWGLVSMSPCPRSQVDGAATISTAADCYDRRKECSGAPPPGNQLARKWPTSCPLTIHWMDPVLWPESTVVPCAWHVVNSINACLRPLPTPELYHSLVFFELCISISTFHFD